MGDRAQCEAIGCNWHHPDESCNECDACNCQEDACRQNGFTWGKQVGCICHKNCDSIVNLSGFEYQMTFHRCEQKVESVIDLTCVDDCNESCEEFLNGTC